MGKRAPTWTAVPSEAQPSEAQPGLNLIVLGNAEDTGRTAFHVATRLRHVLAEQPSTSIVLSTGTTVDRHRRACTEIDPSSAPLFEVVTDLRDRGGFAFAVPGERALHCPTNQGPWDRPASQFVVQANLQGDAWVTTRCDAEGCVHEDGPDDAVISLVMLDMTAWLASHPQQTSQDQAMERLLVDLRTRSSTVPKILVSHVPVEAAGRHGLAGATPDATFHQLPPSVQAAVVDGLFVGVIAGRDHASYADPDLSNAIKRADRRWITQPVFEVVSGTASGTSPIGNHTRVRTSSAFIPDVWTTAPGFAVVHINQTQQASITVHGRHANRWETATIDVTLDPQVHPVETPSPPLSPCLWCRPVPPNER